jgi:hypothetical protein
VAFIEPCIRQLIDEMQSPSNTGRLVDYQMRVVGGDVLFVNYWRAQSNDAGFTSLVYEWQREHKVLPVMRVRARR